MPFLAIINTLPCDYQYPSLRLLIPFLAIIDSLPLRLSIPFLAIINALPCDLRCPSWMGRARTEANIKLEAAKRGVGAERILFTGKFGDDHLDYKRAATIFVDSPEYNAHVTNTPQSQRGVALCSAARRGAAGPFFGVGGRRTWFPCLPRAGCGGRQLRLVTVR
jgi:hypothetical protein